jgi:hypothetical protein
VARIRVRDRVRDRARDRASNPGILGRRWRANLPTVMVGARVKVRDRV